MPCMQMIVRAYACVTRTLTTRMADATPNAQLLLLLLSTVFVAVGDEVASVQQAIKACQEELKDLPKGDPERVPLRQELAALREKEVLLMKQAQGWFLPSDAQAFGCVRWSTISHT